ncbi:MAG: helix-turn-helix domain-containing protein [Treponema sp.]|nr:helix-turn-helix domain-containing protein [Treponema sp.]
MSGFSEILKKIRESKGITQEQLSEKTELSQSAISQYEKGLRTPVPAALDKIAKALGVEKAVFFPSQGYEKVALNRTIKGMTPDQVKRVTEFAEFIKTKENGSK